jgi:hypothetical protein
VYMVWSPMCKGVSLESVCGATLRMDHVSRELHLEDGDTHL